MHGCSTCLATIHFSQAIVAICLGSCHGLIVDIPVRQLVIIDEQGGPRVRTDDQAAVRTIVLSVDYTDLDKYVDQSHGRILDVPRVN